MRLQTFTGHTFRIGCLLPTPYNSKLLSGSFDGFLKIWNISNDQCLKTIKAHSAPICNI